MSDEAGIVRVLDRARWEMAHGRPYLGYRLCWEAWSALDAAERPAAGRRLLEAALDVCLDYLEQDAEETVQAASALLDLGGAPDARALVARGVARSLAARSRRRAGDAAAALELARGAERDLRAATELAAFDANAWGSLGGLYKRMGTWARADGDDPEARRLELAMLAAYEQGADGNRDAYTLLGFLEYRTVVERRAQGSAVDKPLVRTKQEWVALERALQVRRQQLARGEDAPWAAFDLARGQHYLRPNVLRFLSDLGVAVDDARRVARAATDRWRVESASASLRDLHATSFPLDGLEDAVVLLGRAASDEGWTAGSWAPLARGEEFLVTELACARQELAKLAGTAGAAQAQLAGFAARAEERWAREDEERFQEELARFRQEIEPRAKKELRVLWKLFGAHALEAAITELPALLGLGPLGALSAMVVKYAVTRVVEGSE